MATESTAETGAKEQKSTEDTGAVEGTVLASTLEEHETNAELIGSEGLTISVLLNGHTGSSLRNFISMVYFRGKVDF